MKACNFIKKRLQHRCFSLKFAKFLRTPLFTEHSGDCFCTSGGCFCNSLRVYPMKLKTDMLNRMNNTFQNTIFQISVNVPLICYTFSWKQFICNQSNLIIIWVFLCTCLPAVTLASLVGEKQDLKWFHFLCVTFIVLIVLISCQIRNISHNFFTVFGYY